MRRRDDKVLLKTLRLLVVCQAVTAILPLLSFVSREVSLGKFLLVVIPVTLVVYLTLELRRGMKG